MALAHQALQVEVRQPQGDVEGAREAALGDITPISDLREDLQIPLRCLVQRLLPARVTGTRSVPAFNL
jgi:hypothetical protein